MMMKMMIQVNDNRRYELTWYHNEEEEGNKLFKQAANNSRSMSYERGKQITIKFVRVTINKNHPSKSAKRYSNEINVWGIAWQPMIIFCSIRFESELWFRLFENRNISDQSWIGMILIIRKSKSFQLVKNRNYSNQYRI